ncbi:hypothetical protein [Kitasatospora sp. NPDC085879]|uniref:hypothetical protein n=1 Tax=Kitasatospora sp. NPDC085879 TaxID=3154769 RepID=UPI000BB0F7F8|nr:hypothetical protein [Streptomyces sp. TLI_235]PBC69927.1 hypothetical protein BX265_7302 [Streptomyces sp. TLI_235]
MQRRTGDARIGRLTRNEQLEVLVLVQRSTKPGEPPLSVLLTEPSTLQALQLFRDLADRVPVDDAGLVAQLAAERDQLHQRR